MNLKSQYIHALDN